MPVSTELVNEQTRLSPEKNKETFNYDPKELDTLLEKGAPNEIFMYLRKLILVAFTEDIPSFDLPSVLSAKQLFYTHHSVTSYDANAVQCSILLDLLFLCKNSENFSRVQSLLDSQQKFIFLKLADLTLLKKIKKYLTEKTSPDFSKEYMKVLAGFSEGRFNLLGYSMLSKDLELFNFLLTEDLIDPKAVGTEFHGHMVQWLLILCSKDESYYPFYSAVINTLGRYTLKYNRHHPQLMLPDALKAVKTFSPLAYVISKGGGAFALWLIQNFKIDWMHELAFKTTDGMCPLWIAYHPDHYSSKKLLFRASIYPSKDVNLSTMHKLFLKSLLLEDNTRPSDEEKRANLENIVKEVFNNFINFPALYESLKENTSQPALLQGQSRLQQLIIFSKDNTIEQCFVHIARELKTPGDWVSLLEIYGIIRTLSNHFSAYKSILQETSPQDLNGILDLLGGILLESDPELLNGYLKSSGYDCFGISIKLESLRKLRLNKSPVADNEASLLSQLTMLEWCLENPDHGTKQIKIDHEIEELSLKVAEAHSKKLNQALKKIKHLRDKLTVGNQGRLELIKPAKKEKNKQKLLTPVLESKLETSTLVDTNLPESFEIQIPPEQIKFETNLKKHSPPDNKNPALKSVITQTSPHQISAPKDYLPTDDHHENDLYLNKLLEQELDNLDLLEAKLTPQALPLMTSTSSTAYTQISNKGSAYQEYVCLYLRQMHVELTRFIQSIVFRDKTLSTHHSEIARIAHKNALASISNIEEYLVTLFPSLPLAKESLPPPEVLWNITGLKDGTSHAAIKKFDPIYHSVEKKLAPSSFTEIIKLFHVWNDWTCAHLKTLEILQTFPNLQMAAGGKKLKRSLEKISQLFHDSFLPVRYKTEDEHNLHALLVDIYDLFDQNVKKLKIGSCKRLFEHGTQPASHLSTSPSFSSDMDALIEVEATIEQFLALKKAFNNSIKQLNPLIIDSAKIVYEAEDYSNFLCELRLKKTNYKIDLQVVLTPLNSFEKTLPGRMLPFASLGFNLKKGTLKVPINSLDLADLFTLMDLRLEQINAWIADPSKIAFILRVLAKCYTLAIPPEPISKLMSLVGTAFEQIIQDPSRNPKNALTMLFGKESLRIAGFHKLLIQHNLVSIFDLSLESDGPFLKWFDNILQKNEELVPGWSRPCANNISAIDYLTIIFLYIKKTHSHIDLYKIASRCLAPSFAAKVMVLVNRNEQLLPIHGNLLPICKHFPLTELFPETMVPGSNYGALLQRNGHFKTPLSQVSFTSALDAHIEFK